MNRTYLQDELPSATLTAVTAWSDGLDAQGPTSDTLHVLVDGAIVESDGLQQMRSVYGAAVHAFDGTPLADYEELGLFLWPWRELLAIDGLDTLRKAVAEKPCLSFVRSSTTLPALCATLAWLAAAETSDGMPLYLRIGDTRVLGSFLPHMRPAQEARLHAALHAWAWPGRNGRLQGIETEAMPTAQPAAPTLVLDDAQYAALLDEAEADMLHAGMKSVEAGWTDERRGSELHRWLKAMSQKMGALGIHRQKDQWAFVSLALRAPDGFEALPELGESWLRVRSGTAALHDEISRWDSAQWQALKRLANEKAAASAAPSKGFR